MKRFSLIATLFCGLLIASASQAATLTLVNRSDWAGGATLPSYLEMWIYVPDNLVANPAIVVSAHSCGGNPDTQLSNMNQFQAQGESTILQVGLFPTP